MIKLRGRYDGNGLKYRRVLRILLYPVVHLIIHNVHKLIMSTNEKRQTGH